MKANEYGHPEAQEIIDSYCRKISLDEFNFLLENINLYIKANPDRPEGYFERANFYFDNQRFEQAIEDYTRGLVFIQYPET